MSFNEQLVITTENTEIYDAMKLIFKLLWDNLLEIKLNRKIMKVLGIDPGTATTGWAVVEEKKGEAKLVACGCINTNKNKADAERLVEIGRDIQTLLRKYKPSEVAVEDIFFFKNLKTAIAVAQARGIILYELKKSGISIQNYTPLQIKQALTGYGRADKKQIQIMVKKILKLARIPKPDDAADAIAIAICHLNSRKYLKAKL